jgi:hypothetical protein
MVSLPEALLKKATKIPRFSLAVERDLEATTLPTRVQAPPEFFKCWNSNEPGFPI